MVWGGHFCSRSIPSICTALSMPGPSTLGPNQQKQVLSFIHGPLAYINLLIQGCSHGAVLTGTGLSTTQHRAMGTSPRQPSARAGRHGESKQRGKRSLPR